MLRLLLLLIFLAAAALAGAWIAERPGTVLIDWLGWRIETTTFFSIIVFALSTIVVAVVWGVLGWLFDIPQKISRVRRNGRAKRGRELFALAFMAAEGGDGQSAKKLTERSKKYLDDPRLLTLLTARSAEAAGDNGAAERAYVSLLTDAKAGLLARRGLAESAARRGDFAGAAEHAAAALEMSKSAPWAFNSLFEHELASGDWSAALEALEEGEKRKFIGGKAARRRRAVILAAAASGAERRGDREQALELSQKASQLALGFAPAAALTARLFAAAGDYPGAEAAIGSAWEHAPHPALARYFAELRGGETAADRAQRMLGLADLNPGHRESRILRIEQKIALMQWDTAQTELEMLLQEGATSRLCSLMAAIAKGQGDDAASRDWLVLAATAPREPDWSDIEPEGTAFAYTDEDWARLALTYGDAGQLIHPRYERYRPEAFPAPSAALLPLAARTGAYSSAHIDAPPAYAPRPAQVSNYAPRLSHAPEELLRQPDDPGLEEAEDGDEGMETKKRSVLSWLSRRN